MVLFRLANLCKTHIRAVIEISFLMLDPHLSHIFDYRLKTFRRRAFISDHLLIMPLRSTVTVVSEFSAVYNSCVLICLQQERSRGATL